MERKQRVILLCIAAAILAVALVWGLILNQTGTLGGLTRLLAGYGYVLSEDDFYVAGSAKGTTISALFPTTSLEEAIRVSQSAGFPSDVDKAGLVELVLVALENGTVITLYLIDGEVELAFIQVPNSQKVLPLQQQ